MSKHFNSKEQYLAKKAKQRRREKHSRRVERARILKLCEPEIDRLSAANSLAELLATQIIAKESEKQFIIDEAFVSHKLTMHELTKASE